jgi:serine/threonine protein kinase
LPPYFASDEDLVERFKREALAVAKLRHPHIVQVYDFGRSADWFYIAMEFFAQGSLQEKLSADGCPTIAESVDLMRQVAEGLDHAHERQVVHRDIKPSNILLTGEGEAVITDFGIVKMLEGSRLTQTGSAGMGTAEYMSPEQSQGEPVDARADLYSLGVVLFELLTGALPFTGDNPMVTMHRQVYEAPVSPALSNPAVSPQLADIVLRLLAKDPAERYESGKQLANDLAAWGRTPAPTLLRRDTRLMPPVESDPDPRSLVLQARARDENRELKERPSSAPARWRRLLPHSARQMFVAFLFIVLMGGVGYGAGSFVFSRPEPADISGLAAVPGKESRPVEPIVQPGPRPSEDSPAVEASSLTPTTETPERTLATLMAEPEVFTLTVGQQAQFVVSATWSNGDTETPAVLWQVSDESVATVDTAGVVTAVSPGEIALSVASVGDVLGAAPATSLLTIVDREPTRVQRSVYRLPTQPQLTPEPSPWPSASPEIELKVGE